MPNMRMRRVLRQWLINGALTTFCIIMLYPIFSTLLLSIKAPEDVRRKPPVLIPCDSESAAFRLSACRFSLEGYQRIFLLQSNPESLWGFRISGRIFTQYMPNTLLYATASATLTT